MSSFFGETYTDSIISLSDTTGFQLNGWSIIDVTLASHFFWIIKTDTKEDAQQSNDCKICSCRNRNDLFLLGNCTCTLLMHYPRLRDFSDHELAILWTGFFLEKVCSDVIRAIDMSALKILTIGSMGSIEEFNQIPSINSSSLSQICTYVRLAWLSVKFAETFFGNSYLWQRESCHVWTLLSPCFVWLTELIVPWDSARFDRSPLTWEPFLMPEKPQVEMFSRAGWTRSSSHSVELSPSSVSIQ